MSHGKLESPLVIDSESAAVIASHAVPYAMTHGLVLDKRDGDRLLPSHAPFTLQPSPFPKDALEFAFEMAPIFSKLAHACAEDVDFLYTVLEPVSETDEFVAKLLELHKKTADARSKNPLRFGVWRSDYMLHSSDENETVCPLQVENNTISAGFGALAPITANLHRYLNERGFLSSKIDMPEPQPLSKFCAAFAAAHELYLTRHDFDEAVVVFVVQPNEANQYDQRHIEYGLWELHGLATVRLTHAEVHASVEVDEGGVARYEGKPVSVFYFRSGYTPKDYPSEVEWEAREKIEACTSIASPTIGEQLAGTKKVQQVLAEPGAVSRFPAFSEEEVVSIMRATAGIYTLDDNAEGDANAQMALDRPNDFVLKPQREGGGNNLYKEEITEALSSWSKAQRSAHILMDRITPPEIHTFVVRHREVFEIGGVSELGVFAAFVSNGEEEVVNGMVGHMLRTKIATVDDGGVAAGVAVLDSPLPV